MQTALPDQGRVSGPDRGRGRVAGRVPQLRSVTMPAPGRVPQAEGKPMSQPHHVYVGTIGEGLWRSKDGGETFSRACDGMFVECHVRALSVHPRDDRVLLLGCELGLFR